MVSDRFAAVDKDGNLITGEDTAQRNMILIELTHQDSHVAIPAAGAHVTQSFARSPNRLGFGVGAINPTKGCCAWFDCFAKWNRIDPMLLDMLQERVAFKPALGSLAEQDGSSDGHVG